MDHFYFFSFSLPDSQSTIFILFLKFFSNWRFIFLQFSLPCSQSTISISYCHYLAHVIDDFYFITWLTIDDFHFFSFSLPGLQSTISITYFHSGSQSTICISYFHYLAHNRRFLFYIIIAWLTIDDFYFIFSLPGSQSTIYISSVFHYLAYNRRFIEPG